MDFVAFDVETALGTYHSICSWGAVLVINGEIVDRFYTLVNPETIFEVGAMKIHKITPFDVEGAPTFPELWQQLPEWFFQYPIVAHNAQTEYYALAYSCERYTMKMPSLDFRCSCQSFKKTYPEVPSGLKEAAAFLNIPFKDHHQALADAECAAQIAIKMLKQGYPLIKFSPSEKTMQKLKEMKFCPPLRLWWIQPGTPAAYAYLQHNKDVLLEKGNEAIEQARKKKEEKGNKQLMFL